MSERAHSHVGASSASRWMVCPGSVRLSKAVGSRAPSEYASEGTAAHSLAERCLRLEDNARDWLGESIEADGRTFIVDEDMAGAVQVYLDYIREKCRAFRIHQPLLKVEYRVDLSWLRPDMFGTADFVLASHPNGGGTVFVMDYKHGRGHSVNVEGNSQLRYYALGPTQEFKPSHVIMAIVQPRAPHPDGVIRTTHMGGKGLLRWGEEELGPAYDRTLDPDAPLVAGDHCLWCPGLARCPKALEHAQREAQLDFDAVEDFQKDGWEAASLAPVDASTLAKVLRAKPFMVAYLNACEREVYRLDASGSKVPGWKRIRGSANRRWTDTMKAAEILGEAGIARESMFPDPKLVSPNQAEKLIGGLSVEKEWKRTYKDRLMDCWEKPPGKPRLVPEDTPGEALKPDEAPDVPSGEFEPEDWT